jgi:hypothetical protein
MFDLAARDREVLVVMMDLLCHRVDVARRRRCELGFDSGEPRTAMRILDVALSKWSERSGPMTVYVDHLAAHLARES